MISEAELKKVAKLARLQLSAGELEVYPEQFAAIFEYFEQIAKLDTSKVEPLITPTDMVQHMRQDQAEPWKNAEVAMQNAPERLGNLFKVPPVV